VVNAWIKHELTSAYALATSVGSVPSKKGSGPCPEFAKRPVNVDTSSWRPLIICYSLYC
jgi:hypothetical protein